MTFHNHFEAMRKELTKPENVMMKKNMSSEKYTTNNLIRMHITYPLTLTHIHMCMFVPPYKRFCIIYTYVCINMPLSDSVHQKLVNILSITALRLYLLAFLTHCHTHTYMLWYILISGANAGKTIVFRQLGILINVHIHAYAHVYVCMSMSVCSLELMVCISIAVTLESSGT